MGVDGRYGALHRGAGRELVCGRIGRKRCGGVLLILSVGLLLATASRAQEDKKPDDLKPADPDTGESTVEETTLGLLLNPFEKNGIKFAATYIGEAIGNPS